MAFGKKLYYTAYSQAEIRNKSVKRAVRIIFKKTTYRARNIALATSLVVLQALVPISALLITSRTAPVLAADTGFKTPTSAHTPNDWDTFTVANVQTSDNIYATDNDEEWQGYSNFDFPSVPAGSTSNGIEVQIEAKSSDSSGCQVEATLSWDNGSNDTDQKEVTINGSDSTVTLGGSSDTWAGHTWAVGDFTNANFVVKIRADDVSGNDCANNAVSSIDYIQVRITYTEPVASVYTFSDDSAGANDEPGQKDLTRFGQITSSTDPLDIVWNWDITSLSGNNTADGCALFDTDNDGFVNYALCVTWAGNQVQEAASPQLYSCNDSRVDRCAGDSSVVSFFSTCSVANTTDDPFPAGESSPNDTRATCSIPLSDVGGAASADLLDVCSYPSTQPNSDPSDCVVIQTNKGNLTIIKDVVPDDVTSNWNFAVSGATSFNTSINGDGSSGINSVDLGTYSITETAGANTSLSDYSTSWSCSKNGSAYLSGTGATASNIVFGQSQGSEDSIVCTFTNTLLSGTMTLIKSVTNNNGGTAGVNDFGLSIGGTAVTSGQTLTLTPGSYAINEAGLTGYSFVSITGTGCPATLGGNVTLANNQNITCTVTNDDQAGTLTVNKVVVNDNGGNAQASDFSFTKTGDVTSYNFTNGNTTLVGSRSFTVNAGTYSATENSFAGYTMTGNTCSGVVVPNGGTGSCTITNNDIAPSLTVVKKVINNNGGDATADDFVLKLNGNALASPVLTNNNLTATYSVANESANTAYTVTEDQFSGYVGSSVTCKDNTTDQTVSHPVTLNEGQSVTCTITNDDVQPKITLIKAIDGSQYGDDATVNDFGLTIDSVAATSGTSYGKNVGLYAINEAGLSGYNFVNITGDAKCPQSLGSSVSLLVGDDITCTIHNSAAQPKLIVKKHVITDNGGQASAGVFTMNVTGTNVSDASFPGDEAGTEVTLNEGSYSVDENSFSGYTKSLSEDCSGTIAIGETKTCTITNDDQQAYIIVDKTVDNGDGGNALPNDFLLTIDGNIVSDGVANTINPGTYTISETNLPGYLAETWGGDCNAQGSVTVALGETKTCTITNDDNAPTLTIVKNVVNDNGGTATISDFDIENNNSDLSFGSGVVNSGTTTYASTPTVLSNTDYTLSEIDFSGYTEGTWSCTDDTNGTELNVTVNLNEGEDVTCTVTNNDNAPSLTLNKVLVKNDGGSASESDWTLTATGTQDIPTNLSGPGADDSTDVVSGTDFKADTYTLGENGGPSGYSASSWTCTNNITVTSNQITLANGQTTVCTITNDDQPSTVIVTKYHDLDESGTFNNEEPVLEDWEINLAGETMQTTDATGTTTFSGVSAGSKQLSENQQVGWVQSGITCENVEGSVIDAVYNFSLGNGQTINCFIGNHGLPVLNITKSNDKPSPTAAGDTVTYTIVVTVPADSGRIYGSSDIGGYLPVTVTDTPPNDFTYVLGSWTADSTERGDLKSASITTEPIYASPGVWNLTTLGSNFLVPGEVVTLTYQATIGSSVPPGTYPDTSFVGGYNQNGTELFGVALGTCNAEDIFAKSCVTIQAGQVLGDRTGTTPGQVLGTGQVLGLADTGSPVKILQIVIPMLVITTVLVLSLAIKRKNSY